MATLFLAMIANCMFFRTEDEQTLNSEAISIGPITLTPQQISNSLFSSFIVFPPVVVIALLFSKSVPKSDALVEPQHRRYSNGRKPRTLCNPLLSRTTVKTTTTTNTTTTTTCAIQSFRTGASTSPGSWSHSQFSSQHFSPFSTALSGVWN